MKKKNNNKKIGLKFEKDVASLLEKKLGFENLTFTIGSGCFWHSKGDLVGTLLGEEYLIEIKGTNKDRYRISNKLIEKIWNEALEDNKLPLLSVLFSTSTCQRLAVIHIGRLYKPSEKLKKGFTLKREHVEIALDTDSTLSKGIYQSEKCCWLLDFRFVQEVRL